MISYYYVFIVISSCNIGEEMRITNLITYKTTF